MSSTKAFPDSIAVAGFGGYIGDKVASAALTAGVRVFGFDPYAYDPGELSNLVRVQDERFFYSLTPDFFHLALHPEARQPAVERLLARAAVEPIAILMEKPMAAPDDPESCRELIKAVEQSSAVVLFDFPELFDPLTMQIFEYLRQFDAVEITEIFLQRSKDREGDNARNRKKIVPIQFQESVHCVAFLLFLLGSLRGSYDAALKSGLSVEATSLPYAPPNPEAYPYVVDGRCDYMLRCGETNVHGITDFKRGAAPRKLRWIKGIADGEPFEIEVDFFEGAKYLRINGIDQGVARESCSYQAILATYAHWLGTVSREILHSGVYPHARFAELTYALSAMLWRSSFERETLRVESAEELRRFDSGFREACATLPKY